MPPSSKSRFPNQAKVLRQLIDQQAQGSASGSVLGQIGKMIAKPQPPPPPQSFLMGRPRLSCPDGSAATES